MLVFSKKKKASKFKTLVQTKLASPTSQLNFFQTPAFNDRWITIQSRARENQAWFRLFLTSDGNQGAPYPVIHLNCRITLSYISAMTYCTENFLTANESTKFEVYSDTFI